jgi:type IV secretory pathway TrbL component
VSRSVRIIANFATNIAQVFVHVSRERLPSRHNFIADAAGEVAKVNVEVQSAAPASAKRLLTHFANELAVAFGHAYPRSPSRDRRGQGVACGKSGGVNACCTDSKPRWAGRIGMR